MLAAVCVASALRDGTKNGCEGDYKSSHRLTVAYQLSKSMIAKFIRHISYITKPKI